MVQACFFVSAWSQGVGESREDLNKSEQKSSYSCAPHGAYFSVEPRDLVILWSVISTRPVTINQVVFINSALIDLGQHDGLFTGSQLIYCRFVSYVHQFSRTLTVFSLDSEKPAARTIRIILQKQCWKRPKNDKIIYLGREDNSHFLFGWSMIKRKCQRRWVGSLRTCWIRWGVRCTWANESHDVTSSN